MFPRKSRQTALNLNHADFSVSVSRWSDRSSLMISRICGSIKMSSFNLASLSFKKLSFRYSKPLLRLFVTLTRLSLNHKLMCSDGNKIVSLSNSGWYLTHVSPGTEFSHGAIRNFVKFVFLFGYPFHKENSKTLCSQTTFLGVTLWLYGLPRFSINILSNV